MGSTAPRIQALAIVSPRNGPIYVRQFNRSDGSSSAADLRYHYFAHAGSDVMEERSGMSTSSSSPAPPIIKSSEQYLGLLYTLEDLAIYGFQTSTRLRFLIMLTLSDHVVRDIDILTLFRAFHTAYLKYAANPFHMLSPTPSSALHVGQTTTSIDGSDGSTDDASIQTLMQRQQEAHLPVNCRPIRSVTFDRMVNKIVSRQAATENPKAIANSAVNTPVTVGR